MKKLSFMHTKISFFNGFNFCSLGIALDSWSPEAGFIPNIYIKGKNKINKGNWIKKLSFMHKNRSFFNGFNSCSLGIVLDSWSPEAGLFLLYTSREKIR